MTFEITDDRAAIDVDLVHRELAASYWSPGVPRAVVEAAIAGTTSTGPSASPTRPPGC